MNLTPKVNGKYGAPMGRNSWGAGEGDYEGMMFLQYIPLNSGGYDRGGAYWGVGKRLYGYASYDDSINGFIRAYNREDAKQQVLALYSKAKFWS